MNLKRLANVDLRVALVEVGWMVLKVGRCLWI